MSSLSLHRGDHDIQDDGLSLHPVRDFAADWLEATPAAIVMRPVGTFLTDWVQATPMAILFRSLQR
ncbi:hypothetical protein A6A40_07035 [Azospirillum humicireducens]|uniref:Uncharacterized protein n=1 Tax=Azospirillum humicireducens TaxID=1226968 RepID=A0A160JFL1_9PROT|nr:hypothetical protein [Azospirillum humicireducens]ANC91679.1 hypothetical protein A6A40_07035 [Azospirillum humicireducens]